MGKLMFHDTDVGSGGGAYKVTAFQVSLADWVTDTTSQSGTTLYKKQVNVNHVYIDCPDICIGVDPEGSASIPSKAEQTAYDLIQYITVNRSTPCLYIYATAIPVTAFYIKVEGVD